MSKFPNGKKIILFLCPSHSFSLSRSAFRCLSAVVDASWCQISKTVGYTIHDKRPKKTTTKSLFMWFDGSCCVLALWTLDTLEILAWCRFKFVVFAVTKCPWGLKLFCSCPVALTQDGSGSVVQNITIVKHLYTHTKNENSIQENTPIKLSDFNAKSSTCRYVTLWCCYPAIFYRWMFHVGPFLKLA